MHRRSIKSSISENSSLRMVGSIKSSIIRVPSDNWKICWKWKWLNENEMSHVFIDLKKNNANCMMCIAFCFEIFVKFIANDILRIIHLRFKPSGFCPLKIKKKIFWYFNDLFFTYSKTIAIYTSEHYLLMMSFHSHPGLLTFFYEFLLLVTCKKRKERGALHEISIVERRLSVCSCCGGLVASSKIKLDECETHLK